MGRTEWPFTGLRCPSCKRPIGIIEDVIGGRILVMRCPACGNRWNAEGPQGKPH